MRLESAAGTKYQTGFHGNDGGTLRSLTLRLGLEASEDVEVRCAAAEAVLDCNSKGSDKRMVSYRKHSRTLAIASIIEWKVENESGGSDQQSRSERRSPDSVRWGRR